MTKYIFFAAMVLCINVYALPSISNVEVFPLSPWGGVVSYSVTGALPNYYDQYSAWVVISDTTTAVSVEANIVKGDRSLTLGEHQLWWNGPALKRDDYTVSIKYEPRCLCGEIPHNYVFESMQDATCTTPQTSIFRCSVCLEPKYNTYGSALGHDWVPRGTDYSGATVYKCRRCFQWRD